MKAKTGTTDPDILGALPAMRRAARYAKQLAIQTNTPLWVMRNGKIVNANPSSERAAKRKTRKKKSA